MAVPAALVRLARLCQGTLFIKGDDGVKRRIEFVNAARQSRVNSSEVMVRFANASAAVERVQSSGSAAGVAAR